ncbi:alpha/beta hydrolase [Acrocarpospora catenulata]|uniref:alpha/beta hydrolase n=1 Tax=Acrocarpospora catenulata TaxID=2836182 RepID=UPI001BDB62FD|nr:alpha/beta hydrolase [Acrocarpospora catenulata]
MRVEFNAGTIPLVGELRVPDGPGPHPALVFTGPFTGVKEQVTGLYAERLTAHGYLTLAFDHRNFGESGGEPRRHEDPQGKLDDLRAAVGFLRTRPEVDAERIGAVGICLGGGYALKFAAFDPRVKVFVGIAGAYNSPYTMREGFGADGYAGALADFGEVLARQDLTGTVDYQPAVGEGGAMSGDEPFAYYGTERGATPTWVNEVTTASVRELITMDNLMGADFLSPKPALLVHGVVDAYCSPEGAHAVHARLDEPKRLVWLDAKLHIDLYDTEPYLTQAVDATVDFLSAYLAPRASAAGSPG